MARIKGGLNALYDGLFDMLGAETYERLVEKQIDLGHITGNHHLGADTHTCEEHFHLLRCGVLCLVQNDKGII